MTKMLEVSGAITPLYIINSDESPHDLHYRNYPRFSFQPKAIVAVVSDHEAVKHWPRMHPSQPGFVKDVTHA